MTFSYKYGLKFTSIKKIKRHAPPPPPTLPQANQIYTISR